VPAFVQGWGLEGAAELEKEVHLEFSIRRIDIIGFIPMPNKHPEFSILIVEDNRFFRDALHEALKTHYPFAALAKAATVQKAREKLQLMQPDMIFLDVRLPDGNGLEFTRELRASGNEAVISILTSHDLPEYRAEAMRSGADRFFVKGLTDIGEIFAVVKSTLTPRFRALVVADDVQYRDQMSALLARTRPGAVVACTTGLDEALEFADTLKPHLVMLRSAAVTERKRVFCEQLHAVCRDDQMKVVVVSETGAEETCPAAPAAVVDEGAQERVAIMSSIRSRLNAISTWGVGRTWT
jgi:DNA-binding NarL/FixJ family response regulator